MTIKDIAREAGYAVGTVSRVLNKQSGVSEKARNRIMEVVEKHNFRLNSNAKHLKQQANTGVAVIVKGTRNMLFANLVESLQKLIKEKGYACLVYYIGEEDHEVEQALQVCRERQPLGILFLGSNRENFKERFGKVEIPCVMLTNSADSLEFPNLSSVSINDKEAGKCAIEYLISRGHTKIGILGGERKHSNPAKARYMGCIEAFKEHQIFFDPELQHEYTWFTIENGYLAMKRLLEKTRDITAVFAMSDVTAFGAIRAITDAGLKVPDDISVIGIDGIEMGRYFVPQLTTIQQPSQKMAERCVEILLECIQKPNTFVREQMSFEVMEGESVRTLDTQA